MSEDINDEKQVPSSNNGIENNINNESNDKNKDSDDKTKSDIKKEANDMELEKEEKKENERSKFSLEGAKGPLSMYTRRVMDISKIGDYLKPGSSKGQIGGHNLGNTCFMNSSIACISNCTELTYYFLKGDYLKDINEENDLGMRGEVAREWGKLLEEYWVKNTSVGDPSDFKRTIGRKAVRFRGFGQQDSNEFMSVFLDYLNEDLNKTTKKQYIELKEKAPDETDEQCAKRFWEANLKRNNSIITDLFCGQFKSTITCPECGWINITFDPFDTINLPLLTQHKRRGYGYYGSETVEEMKFYYIPKNVFRNTYCLLIKEVNRGEILRDIIERIKKEKDFVYHDKIDELFIVDMYRGKKYGYAKKNESIRNYTLDDEYLYSFDYDKENSDIVIPLYLWEKDDEESKSKYPRIIFCKNDDNFDIIRKKIYFYIRKFILSPLLKENEEKDELSLEIEKYIGDMKNELPDEKLYEMVENEYNEIFNKYNTPDEKDEEKEKKEKNDENEEMKNAETEKKDEEKKADNKNTTTPKELEEYNKCIDRFKTDIPFKIIIQKEQSYRSDEISLMKSETFPKFNKKLKEYFEMKNFSTPLKDTEFRHTKYEIHVKFNPESKYINKDTFDIRLVDSIKFDYIPKKKEEKKKEEDEDENGEMTLEKCLKKFCKEEQLEAGDEWYCSKCKKHVLAKKKMELYYVPKILIICFKRFIKDSFSWEKNEDKVEFPIDNLDLKNFVIGPDKDHSKYDLFAVSQHYGSTGFGHYTAVCKNDGKWFSYNDSSCSPTSASDAQTSAAYVLFYRRQTD